MIEYVLEVGPWKFDNVEYDAESDVLYASIGEPEAGYGEETPEGHILRFNDAGEFRGVTLVGLKSLSDSVEVTVPLPPKTETVPRSTLDKILA